MTRPRADTFVVPGMGRRLASMLYEALLLLGVLALMVALLVLIGAITHLAVPPSVIRVCVFLCFALYFIWHWHGGRQTLAMRTWHLRITTPSGANPPLWRLGLRYVLAWPSLIFLGAGILWALIDRDRQFLHDRLAGTRLIVVPPTTS